MARIIAAVLMTFTMVGSAVAADAPLVLLSKISLGDVKGALGNVSMDASRGRLLVAETYNDSVSVIDLTQGQLLRRISGINLPLDVDYVAKVGAFVSDTIYVSGGGDGALHTFDGETFAPGQSLALGGEVEDIVIDAEADHVLTGHGDGGIAILDASNPHKIGEVALKAHPEEFIIDAAANRIYANVPNRGLVAVIDRAVGNVMAEWKLPGFAQFNAMGMTKTALLIAVQSPSKLVSVSLADGHVLSTVDTCGEADTILMDDARRRVYVACGNGNIDVFQFDPMSGAAPALIARVPTSPLAKTAFFDPRSSRIYLAVPAKGQDAAAIWVYAAK